VAIGSRSPCYFLVGSRSTLESTDSLLFFNYYATMILLEYNVENLWIPGHVFSPHSCGWNRKNIHSFGGKVALLG
jgi:hypothetical protein